MRYLCRSLCIAATLFACAGCADRSPPVASESEETATARSASPDVAQNPNRNAYFGDLHVHTQLSLDAYLFGSRATPDDAYAFAKGGALRHSAGVSMQMKKPLDFLAVTDHGVYLGVVKAMVEAESGPLAEHALREQFRQIATPADSRAAFAALAEYGVATLSKETREIPDIPEVSRSAWRSIVESAERHNAPGEFTTFVGYEYTTSGPNTENLHRNVIFSSADVPDLPFSAFNSPNPEDLWAWMDEQRTLGRELLAIPHNSNGSDGLMFDLVKSDGSPIDAAYAELRMRNEPLVEQTQVKGTSDTHPLLSPNDEWADFEIMPILVGNPNPSRPEGSYVRDAYKRGIAFAETQGFNPYEFGLIGSSDTHNAAGSFEEDNYWSKTSISDITPEQRGSVPLSDDSEIVKNDPLASGEASGVAPDGRVYATAAARYWGASGLAGVWAESNTRAKPSTRRSSARKPSAPVARTFRCASSDPPRLMTRYSMQMIRSQIAYREGVPMGGGDSR